MKVRLTECENELVGKWYMIEIKGLFGWKQPSISYSEDGCFYSQREAEKWYDYYANGCKVDKKIIKEN
jgi:hypothetical protein